MGSEGVKMKEAQHINKSESRMEGKRAEHR
jgi:hypothetical protein